MGIGLLAAGLSSALTAPLAASYAAKGLFAWQGDESNVKFRAIWISIILIGVLVAITDIERILIIKFAQIANALLLPFIAIYLLYVCNSKKILGEYVNSKLSNVFGLIVILFCLLLSFRSFNSLFQIL